MKVGLRPRPFLTAIIQNQPSVYDKLTNRRGTKEGYWHKGKGMSWLKMSIAPKKDQTCHGFFSLSPGGHPGEKKDIKSKQMMVQTQACIRPAVNQQILDMTRSSKETTGELWCFPIGPADKRRS